MQLEAELLLQHRSRGGSRQEATKMARSTMELRTTGVVKLFTPESVCLDTSHEVVSLWRKRFFTDRLARLEERDRPGRPRTFPPVLVVQVKALACELPTKYDLPLSRWSTQDLVQQVQRSGLVASISGSTLWRWLHEDAIRPWYHRSWIALLVVPKTMR